MLKYFGRICALPFVMGLLALRFMYLMILYTINFIIYGGEFISYTEALKPTSLTDVYNSNVELIRLLNEEEDENKNEDLADDIDE